jgi:hypothetical protein
MNRHQKLKITTVTPDIETKIRNISKLNSPALTVPVFLNDETRKLLVLASQPSKLQPDTSIDISTKLKEYERLMSDHQRPWAGRIVREDMYRAAQITLLLLLHRIARSMYTSGLTQNEAASFGSRLNGLANPAYIGETLPSVNLKEDVKTLCIEMLDRAGDICEAKSLSGQCNNDDVAAQDICAKIARSMSAYVTGAGRLRFGRPRARTFI